MIPDLSLENTKNSIDAFLEGLFVERKQRAASLGQSYEALWATIERVAMAGGKRIRPYLTFLGAGAFDAKMMPVAAAQELIHIAMLMHDDIIDQDFTRHGHDNVGGEYQKLYGRYLDGVRARHYSQGAALLAGDILISEAYQLISGSDYDEKTKQKLTAQLSQSIFDVIGGELMDVEAGFVNDIEIEPMMVYRYKTASYSFIGPVLSGAYAAGASAETVEALRSFATNVGIAYQIQDDLLGVFGNEQQTGKSTLTDIREGKKTLLIKNYELSLNEERRLFFEAVFGRESSATDDLQKLKQDIISSGAKDTTNAAAKRYFDEACEALELIKGDPRYDRLLEFVNGIRQRNC